MIKRAMYAIPAVGLVWTGCGGVDVEAVCGNGFTDDGEQCDDGNGIDGDACTNSCAIATCGDGVTFSEAGGDEACDDGNSVDEDDCTNACEAVRCGDGIVAVRASGRDAEACDDQNSSDTDGCLNTCDIDPVIRAFTITKHRGLEATDSYVFNPYGYASTECNRVFDSPLSMNMALVVTGSYSRMRDCVDNNKDNVVTLPITGQVDVLIARQKYSITLTEGTSTFVLDCDMDAASNLTCLDDASPPLPWTLTAQ